MFPERRMSALEQDRGRADIRRERSQGRRSERSGGNMPFLCSKGVVNNQCHKTVASVNGDR
jgi:hypothetical protein